MKLDVSIPFEDAGKAVGTGAEELERIRLDTKCIINQSKNLQFLIMEGGIYMCV